MHSTACQQHDAAESVCSTFIRPRESGSVRHISVPANTQEDRSEVASALGEKPLLCDDSSVSSDTSFCISPKSVAKASGDILMTSVSHRKKKPPVPPRRLHFWDMGALLKRQYRVLAREGKHQTIDMVFQ